MSARKKAPAPPAAPAVKVNPVTVGSMVRLRDIARWKKERPWLTPEFVWRVQLVDRLSSTPILVLTHERSGTSMLAALSDVEEVQIIAEATGIEQPARLRR